MGQGHECRSSASTSATQPDGGVGLQPTKPSLTKRGSSSGRWSAVTDAANDSNGSAVRTRSQTSVHAVKNVCTAVPGFTSRRRSRGSTSRKSHGEKPRAPSVCSTSASFDKTSSRRRSTQKAETCPSMSVLPSRHTPPSTSSGSTWPCNCSAPAFVSPRPTFARRTSADGGWARRVCRSPSRKRSCGNSRRPVSTCAPFTSTPTTSRSGNASESSFVVTAEMPKPTSVKRPAGSEPLSSSQRLNACSRPGRVRARRRQLTAEREPRSCCSRRARSRRSPRESGARGR